MKIAPALVALNLLAGPAVTGPASASVLEQGRRMYLEGVLPTGEAMTGKVRGDVALSGELVICGTCHRRSGMGSNEGDQVIPAITGEMLFHPLRLPTTSKPLAPQQRPAYDEATLKRAIVAGIDANGEPLDPLMPRYALSDAELDALIAYLKTLSTEISPGVDDERIHFATIVSDGVDPRMRKALVDVLETFVAQKNRETRHETYRKEHAPWHKKWLFGPYRKWVMHEWRLHGPPDTWERQLTEYYRAQPVFAVVSGMVEGSWKPVHRFCQATRLPCLFPTTDLPVIAERDFYPMYLSKGMSLEGELIARHRRDGERMPLVQVHRRGDPRARVAAAALQAAAPDAAARDELWSQPDAVPDISFWHRVLKEARGAALVLWMNPADLANLWTALLQGAGPKRIYLSTTLFGTDPGAVPAVVRDRAYLVHRSALPERTTRLLLRSTGWLRVKHIYAPQAREVQANAYFALKVLGDALRQIRGYFFRDYLLERIEHMIESAPYTSIYPHIGLAPGQRFAAKGGYIVKVSDAKAGPRLVAVTDWLTP